MNNNSNMLRKMAMKINRIERFGAIALEENQIITCQEFFDMERKEAMSFLMNVITDLKNMRSQFKAEGKITFYSNNYIEMFKSIGMTVQENSLTYNHKHVAFLEN